MIQRLQQLGLTPAKAALVAVLAAVLGAVWGPQLAALLPGGGSQATVASRTPNRVPVPSGEPPLAKPAAVEQRSERPLPSMSLVNATRFDPFAAPAWAPARDRQTIASQASSPDEVADRFEVLKRAGVAMLLVSEGGRAARIGDQTLRPGDEIDGFRVVAIDSEGVVFEPAPPSPDGGGPSGG